MSSPNPLPDDWIEAGTAFTDLEKYIQQRSKRLSNGLNGWQHDFNVLNHATTYSKSYLKAAGGFHTSFLPCNREKNRYSGILPYEFSRVLLPQLPNKEGTDYINANFITDPSLGIPGFIASQGPLKHTTFDFWRMIWTYHVPIIIMLTGLNESGRDKCYSYWPSPPTLNQDSKSQFGGKKSISPKNICTSYGNFHVQLLKFELTDERGIVKRSFRISRYENSSEAHCHYCQSHPKNSQTNQSNNISTKSENFSTMDDILRMAEEEAEIDPNKSSLFSPVERSSGVSESDSELTDVSGSSSILDRSTSPPIPTTKTEINRQNSTLFYSTHHSPIESRTITQFHFIAWPDHGVPSSPDILISLVKLVRNFETKLSLLDPYVNSLNSWKARISPILAKVSALADETHSNLISSSSKSSKSTNTSKRKISLPKMLAKSSSSNVKTELIPRTEPKFGLPLIHCSAGVGRTGTFITTYVIHQRILDYVAIRQKRHQLATLQPISPRVPPLKHNPYDIIKLIRHYRSFLVYTCEQYQFIYTAALQMAKTAKVTKTKISYDMFTTPGR